jgi:predicted transcriptional regulator of viral defense system
MKITDIVINRINRFKSGYIFTYSDFDIPVAKTEALKKTLSRLVKSGKIKRLSKGQFYKPEITEFGNLRPQEYQVVKDLLEEDNRSIGYLTGVSAFNKLGLTTQISNTIQIGTNIDRKPKKRGKYIIRFIRQKNTITSDNINILQILDAIRFIKRIPDSDVSKSCQRLISIIKMLPEKNLDLLIKYALKYNPGTRALTGAIVDQISTGNNTKQLLESLNTVSEYNFNISDAVLNNKLKWRIS